MKRLLKDKRGMTLAEIVVALTILMIVVVGTTPVMLSAFDGLYTAGERTQTTYQAKSEIEDALATRTSRLELKKPMQINFKGIGSNLADLGEVATVNAKRAVSSLYTSLESVFTGGKAHVVIVSAKEINDDKLKQQVILQTTNISFTDEEQISKNTPSNIPDKPAKNDTYKLDVSATLPNKKNGRTAQLSTIYNHANTPATVEIVDANPSTGRIIINISGMDFTKSPVKIEVTYVDENLKKKTTHCYLTIKTPTIMLAGETNGADYYTSAGLETKKDGEGRDYNVFTVDARTMNIYQYADTGTSYKHKETGATIVIKGEISKVADSQDATSKSVDADSYIPEVKATVFKSVTWVSNDDHTGSIEPYYVLTGSNGSLYRTYSFTGTNTAIANKVLDPKNSKTKAEEEITLDDRQTTVAYPSVWGGDNTYQFGYSTYKTSMAYMGGDWSWYTEDDNKTRYGYTKESDGNSAQAYSTKVNYAYYYNGWGFTYTFDNQKARTISYILTEKPYALRMGGWMMAFEKGYNENYNKIWENVDSDDLGVGDGTYSVGNKSAYSSVFEDKVPVVYYGKRSRTKKPETSAFYPYYLAGYGTGVTGNRFRDANFAQIRIKYLSTVRDYIFWDRRDQKDTASSNILLGSAERYQANITVTDAVYIPYVSGADSTTGKVFYVGTVDAHAYLNQIDNLGPDSQGNGGNWAKYIFWQSLDEWTEKIDGTKYKTDNYGRKTVYFVSNRSDGTGTEVFKYSLDASSEDYIADTNTYNPMKEAAYTNYSTNKPTVAYQSNTEEARSFFVTRSNADDTSALFSDVAFTMGYTSNRDMAYAQITYGWVKDSSGNLVRKEAYKGCEPYFFLSRYGNSNHKARFYMNDLADSSQLTEDYRNSYDNDYYNVWFPGEMYNMTKIATKDNVTVAVGYAVSGSTYQFINPDDADNASTALSGIHNDGILACMIGGKDTSFKNLLYFKDTTDFDDETLTTVATSTEEGSALNATTYQTAYGEGVDYGTHQRNSVQFTAVDIAVEYTKRSNKEEQSEYYAYYADNRGRLFKSLVATNRYTATNDNYDPNDPNGDTVVSTIQPTMVQWISDQPFNLPPSGGYAENNKPTDDPTKLGDEIGKLTEITINNNSLGYYFSKITSVKCEGDFIIVSGYPNTAKVSSYYIVVGYTTQSADASSNSTVWKAFKINSGATTPTIGVANHTECSMVLDSILYLAGSFDSAQSGKSGWVYALPLEDVRKAFSTATDGDGTSQARTEADFKSTNYALVTDKIYAMDGHN